MNTRIKNYCSFVILTSILGMVYNSAALADTTTNYCSDASITVVNNSSEPLLIQSITYEEYMGQSVTNGLINGTPVGQSIAAINANGTNQSTWNLNTEYMQVEGVMTFGNDEAGNSEGSIQFSFANLFHACDVGYTPTNGNSTKIDCNKTGDGHQFTCTLTGGGKPIT